MQFPVCKHIWYIEITILLCLSILFITRIKIKKFYKESYWNILLYIVPTNWAHFEIFEKTNNKWHRKKLDYLYVIKKTDFGISFDSHHNDISKVMISFDISWLQIQVGLKILMTKNMSSINLYLKIKYFINGLIFLTNNDDFHVCNPRRVCYSHPEEDYLWNWIWILFFWQSNIK